MYGLYRVHFFSPRRNSRRKVEFHVSQLFGLLVQKQGTIVVQSANRQAAPF